MSQDKYYLDKYWHVNTKLPKIIIYKRIYFYFNSTLEKSNSWYKTKMHPLSPYICHQIIKFKHLWVKGHWRHRHVRGEGLDGRYDWILIVSVLDKANSKILLFCLLSPIFFPERVSGYVLSGTLILITKLHNQFSSNVNWSVCETAQKTQELYRSPGYRTLL